MIDKPLYQNPLGGGFETSFGLLDSNPDREKQYFYNKDLNKLFNMPMGVRMAAPKGFESVNKDQYEDYANKGATLQGANMFNDSMGGGYNLDLPRDQFGSIDRTSSEYDYFYGDNQQKPNIGAGILGTYMPSQEDGMNLSGSNMPLGMFNVTPPSTPVSEQTPLPGIIDDPFKPKSDDPLMQGYFDSDFYSNTMTMDMVPYTYDGKEMTGSSSYASNFKKYLDSIGKGDLLQFPDSSGSLATVGGPNDSLDLFAGRPVLTGNEERINGVGQDVTGNNPIETPVPSTPNPIQGVGLDGAPVNSFNRVGQQLMGPNQDDILGTLKNIEQGIASLRQGGMNQSSFGGFNNNFGIGSFFPPYGGMYG